MSYTNYWRGVWGGGSRNVVIGVLYVCPNGEEGENKCLEKEEEEVFVIPTINLLNIIFGPLACFKFSSIWFSFSLKNWMKCHCDLDL